MRYTRHWFQLIGGATVLLVLSPSSTFALPTPQVVIEHPTNQSGVPELEPITVSGSGCPAGEEVVVAFNNQEVASASAGDDGSFAVTFTVPALSEGFDEVEEGTESSIRVTCGGSSAGVVIAVNPATLPVTGIGTGLVALISGLVLTIGGGLLMVSNRARTTSE